MFAIFRYFKLYKTKYRIKFSPHTLAVKIHIHVGVVRRRPNRRIVAHQVRHHGRLDATAQSQVERLQHHTVARCSDLPTTVQDALVFGNIRLARSLSAEDRLSVCSIYLGWGGWALRGFHLYIDDDVQHWVCF